MARAHAEAFNDIAEVELAGVMGRDIEQLDSFGNDFKISVRTDSINELYFKSKADILVVAVSELSAKHILQEAAEYPWKILAEKPTGITLHEAYELQSIFRGFPEKLLVGFNRRHYSSTRQIQQGLEHSQSARYIEIVDQEDPIAALASGRPKKVTDNWMFANSIHLIDYFTFFGRGEVTSISKQITYLSKESYVLNARLSYSSGDSGQYTAVWNAPGPWSFSCLTYEERWEARPLEVARKRDREHREEILPIHDWDLKFKPGLRLQAEEVINEITNGFSQMPQLTDSIKSMELVAKIYDRG
jgi:predicted dehydrogenase